MALKVYKRAERRNWLRFENVFPVIVETQLHGFINCIARNISYGGVFIEMHEPLPLGTGIKVYFVIPGASGGISAAGEVKNHYFLNYTTNEGPMSIRGIGVKFTEFEQDSEENLICSLKGVSCPMH